MNNINFASFQNNFNSTKNNFITKIGEWKGYLVVKIQSKLSYLEDPRIASTTIFMANFFILELAMRISQLIGLCLPEETAIQKNSKTAFEFILTGVLTLGANIALIKATKISLNPIAIGAIVVVAFIIKTNLQNYVNSREIQ